MPGESWQDREIKRMSLIIFGNGTESLIVKVAKVQTTNKVIIGLNILIFLSLIGLYLNGN